MKSPSEIYHFYDRDSSLYRGQKEQMDIMKNQNWKRHFFYSIQR